MSPRQLCLALVASVVSAGATSPALLAATPPTPPATTLSPTLPATPPPPTGSQADFSDYAWQLFVALNWPAQAGQRGVPNTGAAFGTPGPVVWETFKTTEQLFLPGAADPGPWNGGAGASGGWTFPALSHLSKAPHGVALPPTIQQAVGGWLIDVHSNPTYYEVAVNQTSYDYVRSNGYYNATTVNSAQSVSFPTGSLEVKAAWRIMTAADNQGRFHTIKTTVMTFDAQGNPTGNYVPQTVGLVGLHVVYKATGYPQWIWATFEQNDNAPDSTAPSGNWSYYNPDCTGPYCTPNQSPVAAKQPYGSPNQITRLTPIRAATATSNQKWQALLARTPYANYQLISPQWPSTPNDPGTPQGTPTPGSVANVVLESYIQPTSSCMACHSTAGTTTGSINTNYSFMFIFAQTPALGGKKS